jgi:hypothetical protein
MTPLRCKEGLGELSEGVWVNGYGDQPDLGCRRGAWGFCRGLLVEFESLGGLHLPSQHVIFLAHLPELSLFKSDQVISAKSSPGCTFQQLWGRVKQTVLAQTSRQTFKTRLTRTANRMRAGRLKDCFEILF